MSRASEIRDTVQAMGIGYRRLFSRDQQPETEYDAWGAAVCVLGVTCPTTDCPLQHRDGLAAADGATG
jgi:hypothetical protein